MRSTIVLFYPITVLRIPNRFRFSTLMILNYIILSISTHSPLFFECSQRSFVPHFHPSWLPWHQPGGSQQSDHLRCLLESLIRHSEYFQGLPLRPAEDRLRLQILGPGELVITFCLFSLCPKRLITVAVIF